jgi:hypothetical protein
MYNSTNENRLIVTDITGVMQDYVSIQVDIDETKVKSAALIAQDLDISRIIGRANVTRCIEPEGGWADTPEDDANQELRDLLIPVLCFFTYSRLLKGFQGTFTDSGLAIEKDSIDTNVSKSTANEHAAIAESYLSVVLDFLKAENPNNVNVKPKNLTPRIRSFGGKESRETGCFFVGDPTNA